MSHWAPIVPSTENSPKGTVYLLCFEQPLHHAQHYLGWTQDIDGRLADHEKGRGSKLLAAVKRAGIKWTVTRTWENVTRETERRLKNRGSAVRICPRCQARLAQATPERMAA